MNILYTAFNGINNSSKLLLDKIDSNNKLYLKNSFLSSVEVLKKDIELNDYDLIVSFGQAKLPEDTIKIELIGRGEESYKTKYDYTDLKSLLEKNKYNVVISDNAGGYLCNNLYYNILKYIDDNKLNIDMIFIHIPKINDITNIDNLVDILK